MSKNGHREPLEASIRAEGYVCGTEDIRSPWRRVYGRRATSAAQKILGECLSRKLQYPKGGEGLV